MEWLGQRLAEVEGVVAIALGGSRAQRTHGPDPDWDFGVYYQGTICVGTRDVLGGLSRKYRCVRGSGDGLEGDLVAELLEPLYCP